jgi:D-arginine dehydrogenase
MLPGLREEWTGAVWEPACADIDVAGLHQHYLRAARRAGVSIACRAEVSALVREDGHWRIETRQGETYRAAQIVNAAGAWVDRIAALAGIRPLGIAPLRRTVVQLRVEPGPPADMPLVLDIGGAFYFKPEAGRLWLSPHDEVPSPPCDAAAEELDVGRVIDRLERATTWRIAAVERRWAGLRSFSPDRLPAYGRDAAEPSFSWFAGQGGFGIQTAPAAARLAAQALLGHAPDALTRGIDPARYDPARFAVVDALAPL